jgi:lipopolysaccharide export LptBFGC system permease protein LptF
LVDVLPYWAALVVSIGALRKMPLLLLSVAGAACAIVAVQVWAVFGPVLAFAGRLVGFVLVVLTRISILIAGVWILMRAGTAAFT